MIHNHKQDILLNAGDVRSQDTSLTADDMRSQIRYFTGHYQGKSLRIYINIIFCKKNKIYNCDQVLKKDSLQF
jgi:hypothetical protein